jgi:hypothetical protein
MSKRSERPVGMDEEKGKSMQDNPLISAFTRLRSDLKDCKDIRTFDTPVLYERNLVMETKAIEVIAADVEEERTTCRNG